MRPSWAAPYHVNPTTNLAEIAFMIRPEWQSVGLGSMLQKRMTEYGKSKGLRGFTAEILARNIKMRKLAQGAENVSMRVEDGVYEVTILF